MNKRACLLARFPNQRTVTPLGVTYEVNFSVLTCVYFILYILSLTRHKSLINDIYNIIIDKFRTDIHKHNNDKRISTLAKWLPREKSSFDRQLDFLKNFTDKLYPGMAKSAAYKLYRNHIVTLSKKLNITETLISTKKFDEIVFENVPTVCLRRNMKTFLKHR